MQFLLVQYSPNTWLNPELNKFLNVFYLGLGILEHEEDWKGFRFSGKISKICHKKSLNQVTLHAMMAMPDSKRYLSELCLINPIPTGGWGGGRNRVKSVKILTICIICSTAQLTITKTPLLN